MKYYFNFSLSDRPEGCLDEKRLFEVSKTVKTWLEAKSPRMLRDFPALPYALYPMTYSMLPTEVRKYYRPIHKHGQKSKVVHYYSLRSIDELAEVETADIITHQVIF